MATIKIDLLPKEALEIKKVNQVTKYLMLASRIVVGVFALVVVILFGWFFIARYQLGQVKAKVAVEAAKIKEADQDELRYRLYQEILNNSSKVIAQRRDYKGIFDDLYALLPTEVKVQGLTFGEGVITFDGRAGGVQSFAKTLDSFKKIGTGEVARFKSVALTGVARLGDGVYQFRMEIGLNKT